MNPQVSMRDYEGFGGFGQGSAQEVEELNKALTAGYGSGRGSGGGALRVESLEATLRVLTFNQAHVKFWRDIPKLPAFSTVEEYTVQTSYGGETGMFTREGELPQVQDSAYDRRSALVKFVGTQREVTHPMMLVRPAHGNVIALETQNGAIWLMERLERALFFGRSDTIVESFDGIDKQISDDPVANNLNVIDLRGGALTEDKIEEATNIIVEGYGVATDLYLSPRAMSDMTKQFFPKQHIGIPSAVNGTIGMSIGKIQTQAGLINLKPDIFLRSGKNNGVKRAPTSSTAIRAPVTPTGVVAAAASSATGSQFTTADVGTFQYKVSAINRFGESAAVQEPGGIVVASGDGIDLTITNGSDTADATTGYRIYRSLVNGAAGSEQLIREVPRGGGAATTVIRDLNADLPNTSRAYLIQMNLQTLAVKQLAPMMKIPLATLAASIRWMQLIYLTPIVYQPRKIICFKNVADD